MTGFQPQQDDQHRLNIHLVNERRYNYLYLKYNPDGIEFAMSYELVMSVNVAGLGAINTEAHAGLRPAEELYQKGRTGTTPGRPGRD